MDKFFLPLHGMLTGADMAKENKLNSDTEYVTHYANYPTDILKFSRDTLEMYAIEKQLKTLNGIMDETMELAASSTGDGKRFLEEIKSLSSQMVVLSARLYGVNLSL